MNKNIVQFKSFDQRSTDTQYKDTLKLILKQGIRSKTQQGPDTFTVLCPPANHFRLDNGFPLITERSIKSFWKQSVGEICAFINGVRTIEDLEEFGCKWWAPWGTEKKCFKRGLETGDLGPGSYGAAFHDFPTSKGENFNQFQHLVEQIKELSHLKTHIVTPWIPQYIGRGEGKQQKVTVVPCHGLVYVRIFNNELYLTMVQRSADVLVGVPANMAQYAALTMMLGQVTGFKPVQFTHQMIDAHIYEDQIHFVENYIQKNSYPFPSVIMDSSITDLFAFRKDHFTLMNDYKAGHPVNNIPVAI